MSSSGYFTSILCQLILLTYFFIRGTQFKEDEGTWKGNDDGKVVNNQPQRVMMDNGMGVPGGYIGK